MFVQGARVSKRPQTFFAPQSAPRCRLAEASPDAYQLAKANKHKPWARRWLKANGHWC